MHGIQHLFRQHAIEKQTSSDSWHSTYGRTMSANDSNSDLKSSSPWNQDRILDQLHTMSSSPQPVPNTVKSPSQEYSHSLGSSFSNKWKRSSPDPSKMMMMGRSPNMLDVNSKRILSTTPSRKGSQLSERVGSPSLSGYPGVRRGSLDGYQSPDRNNGFFPHDLDDIYEYKTDHQYFTHTGTSNDGRISIASDAQRNSLFRNYNTHSLDEYSIDNLRRPTRLDNSSFIKNLNSAISQNSVDSGNQSSCGSSNNSKEKLSNKNHHHHSIHEMIKHFGKKVHIWPRNRHDSINENEVSNTANIVTTPELEPDNFRSRSKSLDVTFQRRKILDDCESTYKIYNKILKEGAHMRRASAELAERRRASFGSKMGLRSDGTLDPHHAAILFRDSRGSSIRPNTSSITVRAFVVDSRGENSLASKD
ncbi:hypothetical protein PVAND_009102 [Polypedilum vanderplanki]|uniref:Uncharacterized protein n=1 Tax=Polypedilum vanderplanki TaxID=319348 RepID=A0A9J6CD27_POLVA|nr:hypothetical protein PVAND_009102 [Polypedilum vanderplanki]